MPPTANQIVSHLRFGHHYAVPACTPAGHMRKNLRQKPTAVELHLNGSTTLPRKFGKQIKALGGSYSTCRGHNTTRFVTLPVSFTDFSAGAEAHKLVNRLVLDYGFAKTTVVLRGTRDHSGAVVQYVSRGDSVVAKVFCRYMDALRSYEVAEGQWKLVTEADLAADDKVAEQQVEAAKVARFKAAIHSLKLAAADLGIAESMESELRDLDEIASIYG